MKRREFLLTSVALSAAVSLTGVSLSPEPVLAAPAPAKPARLARITREEDIRCAECGKRIGTMIVDVIDLPPAGLVCWTCFREAQVEADGNDDDDGDCPNCVDKDGEIEELEYEVTKLKKRTAMDPHELADSIHALWADVRDNRDMPGVERRLERLYERVQVVATKG